MKMLFNNHKNPYKEISLTLFCDERKINYDVHAKNESWFYISLIIVPTNKIDSSLRELQKKRNINNYFDEVSFKKIGKKSKEKVNICKSWLDCFEFDNDNKFYYKILGINRDNLNSSSFGDNLRFDVIYKRFFKTVVEGSLKYYFSDYNKTYIDDIYHDKEGNLENNYNFSNNIINKISSENIIFNTDSIRFINSDHNKEEKYKDESQFIQLSDILIGTVSHALDFTSSCVNRHEVAYHYINRINKILTNQYNINSRAFKKYDIDFFPNKKLGDTEIDDALIKSSSTFYKNRDLLINNRKQQPLF